MKQYSEEEQFSENLISLGAKRYDFARCFTPNASSGGITTVTILEGTHALYHLFEFGSIRKQSKSSGSRRTVILKKAWPQSPGEVQKEEIEPPLVTFHPKFFRSDVIKIQITSPQKGDDRKCMKVSLREFLKGWEIQDVGPIIEVAAAPPNLLGLPDGTRLLWRLDSDHNYKPTTMTRKLYSAGSWGAGGWSNILARAFFSQSAASHSVKLIAIETVEGITELLLIYILISASIIESRLSKQHQTREQQRIRNVKILQWSINSFGYSLRVL